MRENRVARRGDSAKIATRENEDRGLAASVFQGCPRCGALLTYITTVMTPAEFAHGGGARADGDRVIRWSTAGAALGVAAVAAFISCERASALVRTYGVHEPTTVEYQLSSPAIVNAVTASSRRTGERNELRCSTRRSRADACAR